MMTRPLLGAFGALLLAVLAGWLWGASANADLERALRASELRDDLREAHVSLLGARLELDERHFSSASQHLESARDLLRRAEARGQRLGWRDEVTRLELVINLRTAKSLGLTIPPSIMVRADQVIQ